MIKKIEALDIPSCVKVIRDSFLTVANEFEFTAENAPGFTAFATTKERLLWQMNTEHRLWYEAFGFVHTKTEKYDFFPFTCGYMEKIL
ncbi:MAG: hypothetical protein J1F60_00845 [Oscillospiraceae bacterium]|nr:hypothetical protein [Oscillospiraceae bacterium]